MKRRGRERTVSESERKKKRKEEKGGGWRRGKPQVEAECQRPEKGGWNDIFENSNWCQQIQKGEDFKKMRKVRDIFFKDLLVPQLQIISTHP